MNVDAAIHTTHFEERIVAGVLFFAGIVGIAIGLSAPATHPSELVLGPILAALGLLTWLRRQQN